MDWINLLQMLWARCDALVAAVKQHLDDTLSDATYRTIMYQLDEYAIGGVSLSNLSQQVGQQRLAQFCQRFNNVGEFSLGRSPETFSNICLLYPRITHPTRPKPYPSARVGFSAGAGAGALVDLCPSLWRTVAAYSAVHNYSRESPVIQSFALPKRKFFPVLSTPWKNVRNTFIFIAECSTHSNYCTQVKWVRYQKECVNHSFSQKELLTHWFFLILLPVVLKFGHVGIWASRRSGSGWRRVERGRFVCRVVRSGIVAVLIVDWGCEPVQGS